MNWKGLFVVTAGYTIGVLVSINHFQWHIEGFSWLMSIPMLIIGMSL